MTEALGTGGYLAGASAGLFGKLPARGDFVREGLRRDFTDPWDVWWRHGLADTQSLVGEAWVTSWLEAPVWRFALPPGLCGQQAVLGVWLPSVDKAGRYYPLTLAATAPFDWIDRLTVMEPFLNDIEQAGRDALEHDLAPDALARMAQAALAACATDHTSQPSPSGMSPPPVSHAAWWTEGGTRVAPRSESGARLPEGAQFATLIDDDWGARSQSAALDDGIASPLP